MQMRLEGCESVEFAAVNVGIPRRTLYEWIRLGRIGRPGFVEFVDMVDRANATLAKSLIDSIQAAVREGNLAAVQWLYKQRISPHEQRALQKQFDLEDRIEAALEENSVADEISEDDIAAAEARALAAADTETPKH